MDELKQLEQILSPAEVKVARLGYALGHVVADGGPHQALLPPEAPEWALAKALCLAGPERW